MVGLPGPPPPPPLLEDMLKKPKIKEQTNSASKGKKFPQKQKYTKSYEERKPHSLTMEEWREIVSIPRVKELWGLNETIKPDEFASMSYGARFDFVSDRTGYCGDLYFVYGDSVSGAPVILTRNPLDKKLEIVELAFQ